MAWFADLAGKAENLLNNLDEQTGAALRNRNVKAKKRDAVTTLENNTSHKKRQSSPPLKKCLPRSESPIYQTKEQRGVSYITKSPTRKSRFQPEPYTMVYTNPHETDSNEVEFRKRRNSLPDKVTGKQLSVLKVVDNLEVENRFLKSELQVVNIEVSSLVSKLEQVQNGEEVVRESPKLEGAHKKLEDTESQKHNLFLVNKTLATQLEKLKNQIENLHKVEINKYEHQINDLLSEINKFKIHTKNLEERIEVLTKQCSETDKVKEKLETELRHAQTTNTTLTSDLEKSNAECKRLEKDWESYKLRVKSMLSSKDKEIKSLQESSFTNDNSKELIDQVENLKEERDKLLEDVNQLRSNCDELKKYVNTLEARHSSTERTVAALRDALKDERAARNRIETQYTAIAKELKTIQIDAGEKIASLRSTLHDRERELNQLREALSSAPTSSDTVALNVADYDVKEAAAASEKVQYLTQKLIQKQETIDSLMADNNTLKIQLQNVENKYLREVQASKNAAVSVVSVQEANNRQRMRSYQSEAVLVKFSRRLGIWIRTHPLFRVFIVIYVISLQLWVLAVLFTSTPDNPISKPTKP